MAQRKLRDTVLLAVRVPIPFAEKVYAASGGREHFPEKARALFQALVDHGEAPGVGALQSRGFQEGKRQGWSAANRLFREALRVAAEKLRGTG